MTDTDVVIPRVVQVDGVPLSALVCEVPEPRAVVVALHGGSATSAYFDYPDLPRASLLRTGAALGFTVVALDRPGYGASASHADAVRAPARRVDLAYAAVAELAPPGVGVFLMAHSIGCELALRMAADHRGKALLGLEIAGTGRHHHPVAREIIDAWRADPPRPPGGLRTLLWQPDVLYPSAAVGGARMTSRSPGYEADVVAGWAATDFAALAARVRVPVRYTLGDHELVWRSGADALADIAGLFTAAPRVTVDEQADAGHNLSLGRTAMAYHLKVLSFVEECVLARERE
ncbi:alpha/beta fold hydrolase [Actinophytocola oryzae]|uniref:Alpha/beta hydrolase family protein n=1 Tax=Actinophytocola oryzae TaxID=502181 RepID=A0A4R7VK76_9PSEU|nr:alpha/beta fold hydrolase [Actinophytocola oryzae]TDV49864.1 alpha/beta hydrolase family protein [Actinophytocola oryzae]